MVYRVLCLLLVGLSAASVCAGDADSLWDNDRYYYLPVSGTEF